MSQQQQPSNPLSAIPAWTIADRLRKAREYAGLKQTELADETGISRQTVSNYENGNTKPSRVYLAAWALRCGVPVEWLRDGTEPDEGPDTPADQASRQRTWIGDAAGHGVVALQAVA